MIILLLDNLLEVYIVDKEAVNGFIYAEIEFDSEEDAKAFDLPISGAIDATENKNYKMKNYWDRIRTEK